MPRPAMPCEVCGTPFVPPKERSRSCSRACGDVLRGRAVIARARHGGLDGRTCELCGSVYRATCSTQRACSRACGVILRGHVPGGSAASTWICRGCGRTRTSGDGQRTWSSWCSYRCQVNASGTRVKSLYRLASTLSGSGIRWRKLLIGYLAERDGTGCKICGKTIDLSLKSGTRGSDLGPSVDHVVPRSEGGSDDLANLRLAHWGCNRSRRTGRPGEAVQLAIVG